MPDLQVAALPLPLAAAGGVLIGLLYFGALWATVRRLPSAPHPATLVAGSFVLRGLLAAAGFVVLSGGEVVPLVAVMGGFLAARTVLIRIVGLASVATPPSGGQEAGPRAPRSPAPPGTDRV